MYRAFKSIFKFKFKFKFKFESDVGVLIGDARTADWRRTDCSLTAEEAVRCFKDKHRAHMATTCMPLCATIMCIRRRV